MKQKGLLRRVAAVLCAGVVLCSFSSCSSSKPEPTGNLKEVTLGEGDVFAKIKVRDYGEITVKLFPEVAPTAVKKFIALATRGYYSGRNFHRVIDDFLVQGGSLTGTGYDGEVADGEYFDSEPSDYAKHFYGALCFAENSKGNYCQFYIVNDNVPVDIDEKAQKLREQLDDPEITGKMLEEDIAYYEDYYSKLAAIPENVKERYAEVGGCFEHDGEDTVFGQVIDGFDVLEAISSVETVAGNVSDDRNGTPSKPLVDIMIDGIEVIRIATIDENAEETVKTSRITASSTMPPAEITTNTPPETTSSEDTAQTGEETAPSEDTSTSSEETTPDESATTAE